MKTIRRANDRGHANHGWLDSYHTFSFGNYYDPAHMSFRSLRVINDDQIAAGKGFGTHPHRDMEIITYVLEGAIEHRDSMGNGAIVNAGDVQRMTAGTGVTHSEFNPSPTDATHLLQIWLTPQQMGLEPSYEQKNFSPVEKQNQLRLVASHDGRDGSVRIHQDVDLYASLLAASESLAIDLNPDRHYWLHVARGRVLVGEDKLLGGDAIGLTQEQTLTIVGREDAEILLFDLA
jgi:quercetin 2,3-dioxygenase